MTAKYDDLRESNSTAKEGGSENVAEFNNDIVKKKKRFAEMQTEQLDNIIETTQAKQSKKATQWAVGVFIGLWRQKNSTFIHEITKKLNSFHKKVVPH